MFDHADADGDGTMAFGEISKVLSKAMATAMSVPVRIIVPSTRDISGQIAPRTWPSALTPPSP